MNEIALKRALEDTCFEVIDDRKPPADMLAKWLLDLSHGGRTVVGKAIDTDDGSEQLTWCAWHALSNPELLTELAEWIDQKIGELADFESYDTVCATSPTALPLAALLSAKNHKNMLAVDSFTFHFFPRKPRKDERIIVIDTIIKTGSHVYSACKQIERAGASHSGNIAIAFHDLWENRLPIVDQLISERRLLFLQSMREFYDKWTIKKQTAASGNRDDALQLVSSSST